MAEGKVTLEIVTPQGLALRAEVDDVAAPSADGEFGVLPGHLPLLAALRTGIVRYHKGGEETSVAVAEGFVEVESDKVLVLTEKIATKDIIDPVRVRLELKEVDDRLDHYEGIPGSPEWQELVGREVWAAAQLELYGDPPPATQRPFEQFGPPAPPEENDVLLPSDDHPPPPDATH